MTGSARLSQEAREKAVAQQDLEERRRKHFSLEQRRQTIEAQIQALRAGFKAEEEEFARSLAVDKLRTERLTQDREAMGKSRQVANAS